MQKIEFSELTNKLHRNLVAIAAITIGILHFDVGIEKAATAGIELTNVTKNVVISALLVLLIYHAVAFFLRAFEEYRLWELNLTNSESTYYGGGRATVQLASQLRDCANSLEQITRNSAIVRSSENVFSHQDAIRLKRLCDSIEIYAKRLKNFPLITRFRFWCWDVGFALVITCITLCLLYQKWPV